LPLAAMSSPAASGTPSPPGESPEATPSGSAHRTLQEHPNRFTLALSEAEKGCLSPRSGRKSGVQSFTDPMNPFARVTSKAITNLQEARNDPERAGARTRTPGMIPVKESSDRMQFAVYRYGHHEWRPQKRCPDALVASPRSEAEGRAPATPMPSPMSPRSSQGATEALRTGSKIGTALGNYLNDMKRTRTSLRSMPGTPSAALRRMNDGSFLLPSERKPCEGFRVSRRSRSLSSDRNLHEQSTSEDPYGFSRKRSVNGRWTSQSNRDFLYHREECQGAPTPRGQGRAQQADQRFAEVVAYMKEMKPEVRRCFSAYKARDYDSTGLLYNISPVLA